MDLSWSQNLIYGAVSGLTEILPVSAQAHRLLLRKIFGTQSVPGITLLLIHIGIFAAVFMCCQNHIVRIHRAKKLARIPKKRRKRPLDMVSLMDYSLLKTMLLPVILAFLFFRKIVPHENNLVLVSVLLLINGIVLYIPQYLPGSNKDSRSLSRVEGLLIGLGGAAAALPGVSALGMASSVGEICGEDRTYSINMALLLELGVLAIFIVIDVLALAEAGIGSLSFMLLLQSLLAAAAAFGTALLGIKFLRRMAAEGGFSVFSYYCWGFALFSLILTLFA